MALFRLARYTIRPDEIARCIAATAEIVADVTANEPGTIQYTCYRRRATLPTSCIARRIWTRRRATAT